MSELKPPHLPSTRIGMIGLAQFTPATPTPLLVSAAIVPATCVPCHELVRAEDPTPHSPAAVQSPGSLGSGSRLLPSLGLTTLAAMMKS